MREYGSEASQEHKEHSPEATKFAIVYAEIMDEIEPNERKKV